MRPEDFAQKIELAEYEETQRRAIQTKRPSLSHCQDCGEEIPPERQKATAVTRCIGCQEEFESLNKRGMS
ncbi:TraR/DksA C4-type zinc finger protein [Nitrosomonas oligotropha]|uniref:TraR/DksA C4-type zinc finger protein n=1 Tax=Nitrosomonas oligotropha TaxID=42354 RepID=UPI00136E0A8C|nr:TraR/DksA C4-type zinc finger protein [Nitrosomonas oligotropha]MXS82259.1 conjugal transfer protein TraR [Nitrosomonas oligotropha]